MFCIFIFFLITDLSVLGRQLCSGWPNLNPCCYTSNQDADSYCHANCRHISAITLQVVHKSHGFCVSQNYNAILDHACGHRRVAFSLLLVVCWLFFSSSSSSRSTKLVIIERLLLLAERYVITIEVGPEFSSDFLICILSFTHTLLEDLFSGTYYCLKQGLSIFFNQRRLFPCKKCPHTLWFKYNPANILHTL